MMVEGLVRFSAYGLHPQDAHPGSLRWAGPSSSATRRRSDTQERTPSQAPSVAAGGGR